MVDAVGNARTIADASRRLFDLNEGEEAMRALQQQRDVPPYQGSP